MDAISEEAQIAFPEFEWDANKEWLLFRRKLKL
jgi:hypothetical protein